MSQDKGQPDGSFCLFGAQQLQKRLQGITREVEGVRKSDDIECVHRMRVASRRLRAAFLIFEPCLPPKRFPRWAKEIRAITRALGAARDLDVQIEFVQGFLSSLEDEKLQPGVRRLLLRLQQRRERRQTQVLRALDELETSGIVPEMEQALREALVRARLRQTSDSSAYVYEQAYQTIAVRLEEMLAYEIYVSQPENVEQLHAMRIAAKRLRYTMEVFEPLFGDDLKPFIRSVRLIQDHLGEIHDADVWADFLPRFLDREQKRTSDFCGFAAPARRLRRGVEAIAGERKAFREQRHRDFVRDWRQIGRDDLWSKLRALVLDRAHAPGAPIPETDTSAGQDETPEVTSRD